MYVWVEIDWDKFFYLFNEELGWIGVGSVEVG